MAEIKHLNRNCGVYLIVSPSNGRYVGSSKSLSKRFNRYKNYSCSRQSAILSSLKKYGYEKHRIKVLMYCKESELLFWERVFGDIYLASANFSNGLTIHLPGYDDVPAVRADEWKDRVSASQKERFKDPKERHKTSVATKAGFTKEVRDKMSAYWKDRCNTDEFRNERSKRQKSYFASEEAREKARQKTIDFFIKNPQAIEVQQSGLKNYYKQNPSARKENSLKFHRENPEIAKCHSEKMKAYYLNNDEAKKILSEKTKEQLKNNHPRARKIINIETGEIFKSVVQVSERIEKPIQTVRNWVNGISNNPTPYKYL